MKIKVYTLYKRTISDGKLERIYSTSELMDGGGGDIKADAKGRNAARWWWQRQQFEYVVRTSDE